MKHTPTPWKAVDVHSSEHGKRGIVYYQIKTANGAKSSIGFAGVYEGTNPKADADFIIEAVNNHDALTARIAELEAALESIDALIEEDMGEWYAVTIANQPLAYVNRAHIRDYIESLK